MMTGAYAKEFEKWLESGRDDDSKPDDSAMAISVDSEDEVDNPFSSASPEEDQRMAGDAAPTLLSDDDGDDDIEMQSGIEHGFEEEPPILEPVPSIPNRKQLKKVFDESMLACVKPHRDKTYSRSNTKIGFSVRTDVDSKDTFKFEHEKKGKFLHSDEVKQSQDFKSSKAAGNIFDKFNAISEQGEDLPPPLIPSPEACFSDGSSNGSGDENFNVKLPNTSPDFCAMEADSTSEILKTSADDHLVRKDTNLTSSKNDVSFECDSTCMLGISPNVVSPGFALTMDVDEAANQSDSHSPAGKTLSETNDPNVSTMLDVSPLNSSSFIVANEEADATNKSCSWDHECPTLEAAVNVEKRGSEPLRDTLTEEPPILSVILPENVQSLRRKRHTIDTVENIGASAKRKNNISASPTRPELHIDIDSQNPPNLSGQAEPNGKPQPLQENSHGKSSKKKKQSKNHRSKSKSRSRSYSFVEMSTFVKTTTKLSRLQSKMHKLVSLLFPQIKSELKSMSPESLCFEQMLIDLVSSMKTSKSDSTVSIPLPFSNTSNMDCSKEEEFSTGVLNNSKFEMDLSSPQCSSSSVVPSRSGHNNTPPVSKHSTMSPDIIPHITPDIGLPNNPTTSESMIPQLSKLSVSTEKEKILKRQPSVVIKTNVHEASKSFTILACKVLQLLLPDLTINLFDYLGNSHQDLLNMIDSMILSNSS